VKAQTINPALARLFWAKTVLAREFLDCPPIGLDKRGCITAKELKKHEAWLDHKGRWKNKSRIRAGSQSGRQTKKPAFRSFIADLCGLEILEDDFRQALETLDAPPEWGRHLPFMIFCLCNNYGFEDKTSALRFADLFAQEPEIFLQVMTRIGRILNSKIGSKEFQVAALHCMVPELWNVKSEAITEALSVATNSKVSPKTVEHARALARAAKPFKRVLKTT
jgi:hypothetical protein